MTLANSKEYLEKYDNLKNGYYDYKIGGTVYKFYTIFEDRSGWIRVVNVDFNNNKHIAAGEVENVKPRDGVINSLRTNDYVYNVKAEVTEFKWPYNQWLRYPYSVYVHNSMERFCSVTPVDQNPNSNLVAVDLNMDPITLNPDSVSIGFGSGHSGDTFFAYGSHTHNGFHQSFSGAGRGAVYVR